MDTISQCFNTILRRNPLGVWVAPGQKSHNALHFYLWNETKRKRDSWFVKETQKKNHFTAERPQTTI